MLRYKLTIPSGKAWSLSIYWMNLLVMKYKCPMPAAWNLVVLMYAVDTFGLLNCTCSYGMTLCKCSVTPSMSLSCGFGLAKFLSQLPSDRAANCNRRATQTTHRPPLDIVADEHDTRAMIIYSRVSPSVVTLADTCRTDDEFELRLTRSDRTRGSGRGVGDRGRWTDVGMSARRYCACVIYCFKLLFLNIIEYNGKILIQTPEISAVPSAPACRVGRGQ